MSTRRPSLRGVEERNALVVANLRLVPWTVQRYAYTPDKEAFEQRVAAGYLGLIRAAELFDESRGFKFSSYAVQWIRQAIQRSASSTIHVSEGARGRAARAGTLLELPRVTASLDQPVGDGDHTLGDLLRAPEDEAERRELLEHLRELLDRLPEIERRAVLARIGQGSGKAGKAGWSVVRRQLGVSSNAVAKALYERGVEHLRAMAREAALSAVRAAVRVNYPAPLKRAQSPCMTAPSPGKSPR